MLEWEGEQNYGTGHRESGSNGQREKRVQERKVEVKKGRREEGKTQREKFNHYDNLKPDQILNARLRGF